MPYTKRRKSVKRTYSKRRSGKSYKTQYRKKRYSKGKKKYAAARTKIPRHLPLGGVGDSKIVKLKYTDITNTFMQFGSPSNSTYTEYFTNGAYDVSASLGNTAMPGYEEWTDFYNSYRVLRTKIKATFANNTDLPTYVGVFMDGYTNSGALSNWANARELEGNLNNKSVLLGGNTGSSSVKTLTLSRQLSTLVGDEDYLGDDDYAGLNPATNPVKLLTGWTYMLSGTGIGLGGPNYSVVQDVQITMWIKFYDKVELLL